MVFAHVIPETPVIDQVPVPVGVGSPFGAVTVAENVKVCPSEEVEVLGVTKTVGVTLVMFTPTGCVGPAAK